MAISSKDIETLWGRYQSEGVSKGVSVSQYFEANGIPYVSTQYSIINKVCTFAALQSKCKRKQNNARLFYVECNLNYEKCIESDVRPKLNTYVQNTLTKKSRVTR